MRRHRGRLLAVVGLVVALGGGNPAGGAAGGEPPSGPAPTGAVLPAGFEDTLVATAPAPTSLAWTPAGQMLVTTQAGRLYLGDADGLRPAPALDLSERLCPRLEQGLLGAAAHPRFAVNGWVYVYWTHDVAGCVQRVSRFTVDAAGVADPGSEVVLVDHIPSPNGNHNGGDLHFGTDGYLYVSTGDGGCDYEGGDYEGGDHEGGEAACAGANDAARDRHVLSGKILRIGEGGEIPPDNPFVGRDSARCHRTGVTEAGRTCQETYAWGLRNPFRIAFDPDAETTRFFVNDVGQDDWEEINEGRAGADYGWNVREGPCANASRIDCDGPPEGMTDPLFAYPHADGCAAVTGGAFVPKAAGWPAELTGDYLFADYACGTIFSLEPEGEDRWSRRPFVTGLGDDSAVDLTFAPSPAGSSLYYTTYGGGGQIRRIDYLGDAERPPRADLVVDPPYGDSPLGVRLDASASRAYAGAAIARYRFDPGDGTPAVEQDGPVLAHTYRTEKATTPSVTVTDTAGRTSDPVTAVVHAGETPPTVTITAPPGPHRIGDAVSLSASAADRRDGPLAAERLTWWVLVHHDQHTHPFLGPVTGAQLEFEFPRPESLRAAAGSYLEVRVAATDAAGLTGTATAEVRPRLVELSFATDPEGLAVVVDGEAQSTPWTVTAWVGLPVRIAALEQRHDGRRYRFERWSDRGKAEHLIETADQAATYTARFRPR